MVGSSNLSGRAIFILAGLGVSLQLLSNDGQSLILAGALISIALNPLLFDVIEPLQSWIRSRSRLARALERADDPLAELPMTVDLNLLTGHVVLVGDGEVGRRIGEALTARGVPIVVTDQNRERVEQLRQRDIPAVCGDASEPGMLIQAHIAEAEMLVIAASEPFLARKMLETERTLNPGIATLVRTYSDEEAELFRKENVGGVFLSEHELALSMARHVLNRLADNGRRRGGADDGGGS